MEVKALKSPDTEAVCSPQVSSAGLNSALEKAGYIKDELSDDEFDSSLDHIVLRDRRKILLSRIFNQSPKTPLEGKTGGLFNTSSEYSSGGSSGITIRDSYSVERESLFRSLVPPNSEDPGKFVISQHSPSLSDDGKASDSVESRSSAVMEYISNDCLETSTSKPDVVASPVPPCLVRVKTEPSEIDKSEIEGKDVMGNFLIDTMFPVKVEVEFSKDSSVDELDHLPLIDRMRLLSSRTPLSSSIPGNLECPDAGTGIFDSASPVNICHPRKRKRTATNSAETALEEDAPLLLKVLLDNGVPIGDIKLYGGIESDDPIDDSFCEDSFADLEAVIAQLFSRRQSFFKFPPIRGSKDSRANYFFGCLLSLVQQAQYLKVRRWPVEMGWCRDLQSFIFVFPKHNRIVLERPEYGYATYFFELLDSLPVYWQIRRLVITMKLSNCCRTTLIENKPLVVGEDLAEGEAHVLAEYGWTPNSGLATMLNFCDRVYHDRKNVDSNEWKSKIAKQLVTGFNYGRIVSDDVPRRLDDHEGKEGPEIKLEL